MRKSESSRESVAPPPAPASLAGARVSDADVVGVRALSDKSALPSELHWRRFRKRLASGRLRLTADGARLWPAGYGSRPPALLAARSRRLPLAANCYR